MGMAVEPTGRPQVIIVDDDAAVRNALVFALQVDGFEVRAYESGWDVLADRDLPIHGCLVIDQRMPGLDGLEMLARLRARGVTLPAMLITTPTAVLQKRALAANIRIVEKPMMTSLIDHVRELIGDARP